MPKFNIPYIHDDTIVYPIKLSSLLSKLCNQVGLELGSTDFPNADYMVVGNPFTNGENCRTVLSNIAQLAGGFAKIGRDDKVYIRTLRRVESDLLKVKDVHNMKVQELNSIPVKMLSSYRDSTDEAIDGNNYFEDFSKNNEWGELNSLVIGLSDIEGENTAIDDKDSINKNGLTELSILDNYFLINQEEREKVINPIWNNLKGLKYLPFKTKYYGYPYLDSGDVIAIDDANDSTYVSYILNHTFKFNGAFNGDIDTPAMTKTQTAYKNTQNTKSMLKRAERKIDKVNGIIEDVLKKQTETSNKLSQHEQTIGEIKDTVKNTEKNLKDNYYTKTETESQITQKADSITSTVEEIKKSSISSVKVLYATSTSQTVAPTQDWSEEAPSWKANQYIWQKTVTTHADGSITETKPVCISGKNGIDGKNGSNGKDGIGITSITPQYYLSDSKYTQSGGQWKDTQDSYIEDYYYWTRSKIVWEDGDTTYTEPILDTGINELNSKITQTATEIRSEVSEKVGTKEIASVISQTAEKIFIKSNKFGWESDNSTMTTDGKITATGGKIGGFDLSANEFKGKLDGIYNYDDIDLTIANNLFTELLTFSSTLKDIFDANNDGTSDVYDVSLIKAIIDGREQNTKKILGTININSNDPKRCLTITKDGELCLNLGTGGIYSFIINAEDIICSPKNLGGTFKGIILNGSSNSPTITVTDGNQDNTSRVAPTFISSPKIIKNGNDVLSSETLYDNISGTNGTVTLIIDSSNFKYIEIYYSKGGSFYEMTKCFDTSKTITLNSSHSENDFLQMQAKVVRISGNNITHVKTLGTNLRIGNNIEVFDNGGTEVFIHKVIGYR